MGKPSKTSLEVKAFRKYLDACNRISHLKHRREDWIRAQDNKIATMQNVLDVAAAEYEKLSGKKIPGADG